MTDIEDALADAGETPEWMEIERFFSRKDRHYAKTYLEEQAKYEKFHEDTRLGIHACKVQRAAWEQLDGVMTQRILEVDQDIRDKVRRVRKDRHKMETELEKIVEEKVVDVRGLMIEEQKSRKTGDVYAGEVTNEICHLYNDLEQAKNYRVKKSERLQEVVSQKLDEVQVAISAERRIREESTHTILEEFGKMGTKMQKEIDAVKVERKESTDRLIQLMEVVLPHLKQARLNHVKLANEKSEDQKAAAKLATDLATKFQPERKTPVSSTKASPREGAPSTLEGAPLSPAGSTQERHTIDTLKRTLPVLAR